MKKNIVLLSAFFSGVVFSAPQDYQKNYDAQIEAQKNAENEAFRLERQQKLNNLGVVEDLKSRDFRIEKEGANPGETVPSYITSPNTRSTVKSSTSFVTDDQSRMIDMRNAQKKDATFSPDAEIKTTKGKNEVNQGCGGLSNCFSSFGGSEYVDIETSYEQNSTDTFNKAMTSWINAMILGEESARASSDNDLLGQINQETSARKAEDARIRQRISQQVAERTQWAATMLGDTRSLLSTERTLNEIAIRTTANTMNCYDASAQDIARGGVEAFGSFSGTGAVSTGYAYIAPILGSLSYYTDRVRTSNFQCNANGTIITASVPIPAPPPEPPDAACPTDFIMTGMACNASQFPGPVLGNDYIQEITDAFAFYEQGRCPEFSGITFWNNAFNNNYQVQRDLMVFQLEYPTDLGVRQYMDDQCMKQVPSGCAQTYIWAEGSASNRSKRCIPGTRPGPDERDTFYNGWVNPSGTSDGICPPITNQQIVTAVDPLNPTGDACIFNVNVDVPGIWNASATQDETPVINLVDDTAPVVGFGTLHCGPKELSTFPSRPEFEGWVFTLGKCEVSNGVGTVAFSGSIDFSEVDACKAAGWDSSLTSWCYDILENPQVLSTSKGVTFGFPMSLNYTGYVDKSQKLKVVSFLPPIADGGPVVYSGTHPVNQDILIPAGNTNPINITIYADRPGLKGFTVPQIQADQAPACHGGAERFVLTYSYNPANAGQGWSGTIAHFLIPAQTSGDPACASESTAVKEEFYLQNKLHQLSYTCYSGEQAKLFSEQYPSRTTQDLRNYMTGQGLNLLSHHALFGVHEGVLVDRAQSPTQAEFGAEKISWNEQAYLQNQIDRMNAECFKGSEQDTAFYQAFGPTIDTAEMNYYLTTTLGYGTLKSHYNAVGKCQGTNAWTIPGESYYLTPGQPKSCTYP